MLCTAFFPQEECKESALTLMKQVPGWCSEEKASSMMDLIFSYQPEVCVEIGVFAGASLLPTACSLKCLGKGLVYAIDPWDKDECVKIYPENDANKQWWENIDMDQVHANFVDLVDFYQLNEQCIILKETSEQAASKIGDIDILHIDGNHQDESALIDVNLYVPKVKKGGYVWFDGWATAPKAFDALKKSCRFKKFVNRGQCILVEKK